jgi:hypothetical protein
VVELPTRRCDGTVLARNLFGGSLATWGNVDAGKPLPNEGPLMLFGSDEDGPSFVEAPGGADHSGYGRRGGAFLEGQSLLFENGLQLPVAETFRVEPAWVEEPFPLRRSDDICLDSDGRVMSVRVWTPY